LINKKERHMGCARFERFPAGIFEFLSGLSENNSREWFDEHRRQYETDVLNVVKAFVADLGPIMRMLNQDLETEPRVGRTVSRINNDLRFHKNRPPYRPFIYACFPRRGRKRTSEAMLYAGVYRHGVSIGFYPGGYRELQRGAVQEGIRKNLRQFQRYLDERAIAESYWELAGGEGVEVTKWPLPKVARRWVNLDSFTVGEYFPASDPSLARRSFLNRAQRILLDLYPLWLFATSDDLRNDLDLYRDNSRLLARPLTRVAG
jgi:uncharacterized protein (TIGR02453 family)